MEPSAEDVLHFHTVALKRHGGSEGIRDRSALEAAIARPWSSFYGQESFPTPFEKAAALCESIIRRHPFIDGNKRSAIAAGSYLLYKLGFEIDATQKELEDLAVDIAVGKLDTPLISEWFRDHSVSLDEK